ncbi:hypothetical protein HZ326_24462 [Fusarium oxysporum f. sp. albedinis]|nr:hypothetical protein HZ326_24462 [Fusarium oxysporum f. sp. albedinis]
MKVLQYHNCSLPTLGLASEVGPTAQRWLGLMILAGEWGTATRYRALPDQEGVWSLLLLILLDSGYRTNPDTTVRQPRCRFVCQRACGPTQVSGMAKTNSTMFLAGTNIWQKCPQQKDDNNCGIFTLAVLQALLNGNSIPSEVDAHHLRSFFAEQLEGTAGLDIVKPSSEAVFPGMPPISRRASLSRAIPTPTTLADLTTLESMTLHSPPELLTRICKEFGKNKSQPERRYKSP